MTQKTKKETVNYNKLSIANHAAVQKYTISQCFANISVL